MLGVGILLPYSFSTLVTMAGLGGKGVFMIVLTLAAAWLADSGAYLQELSSAKQSFALR